jgi:type IV pilus assembly protein PilW
MVRVSAGNFYKPMRPGFTILEMVIAFGIFGIVMLSVVSVFISAVRANRQASMAQSMIDNVRFALEFMEREMRTGREFVDENGDGTLLKFTNDRVRTVCYRSASGVIMRFESALHEPTTPCPAAGYRPLTAAAVVAVTNLAFRVAGQNPTDTRQPRVTVTFQAAARGDASLTFQVETTVSQRTIDVPH